MSQFYIEQNDENAFLAYNKKIVYIGNSLSSYPNLVNFNFGEKFFYGRVDFMFKPIIYNNVIPIKYFNNNLGAGEQPEGAAFVVDAFNDLAKQFQKKVSDGSISTTDPFLSTLKVYKAYTDPRKLYDEHIENYISAIKKEFVARKIEVENFTQFMTNFKSLIFDSAKQFPFTMPAYVKSKYCPITATGLAIEIADVEYFNDERKIQEFINSKNWDFFLNACNTYGFMVDQNIPWRLVADIGSAQMLTYAANYGAGSTSQVISNTYDNAYYDFFNNFRSLLLRIYNRIKLPQFAQSEECDGVRITKFVTPRDYNLFGVILEMSDIELLKLYFDIRIVEEPSKYEASEKNKIIRDCLSLYKSKGLANSISLFEEIINQPFDYNGSLSYLYRQSKMNPGATVVLSKPR